MFDVEKITPDIKEYYFKVFRIYKKKDLCKEFAQLWIDLLESYTKLPDFVCFETKIPLLTRLQSPTNAILVVPFNNTKIHLRNATIFPLYPFRVQLKARTICCKEGISLLLLYLKITNIQFVGFYNVGNYKKIIERIKNLNSKIKCYPPTSFKYFAKINKVINGFV